MKQLRDQRAILEFNSQFPKVIGGFKVSHVFLRRGVRIAEATCLKCKKTYERVYYGITKFKPKNCKRCEELFLSERSERDTFKPEYWVWDAMIQRCTNPKNKNYKNYGARGIKVCKRWLTSFKNFYSDMGPRPDGLQIDRINNNGNYSLANCRWVTAKENCNNTRANNPNSRARLKQAKELLNKGEKL